MVRRTEQNYLNRACMAMMKRNAQIEWMESRIGKGEGDKEGMNGLARIRQKTEIR